MTVKKLPEQNENDHIRCYSDADGSLIIDHKQQGVHPLLVDGGWYFVRGFRKSPYQSHNPFVGQPDAEEFLAVFFYDGSPPVPVFSGGHCHFFYDEVYSFREMD